VSCGEEDEREGEREGEKGNEVQGHISTLTLKLELK
jgi:hypothetical protein